MKKSKTCPICKKKFEFYSYRTVKDKVFCSRECYVSFKQKNRTRICQTCGISFVDDGPSRKSKFCSVKCVRAQRKSKRSKRERKCKICRKKFIARTRTNRDGSKQLQIYCSKTCSNKAQSLGLIKSHSSGNYGYRPDLKKVFRSSLEANFARLLNSINVRWVYEPRAFETSMGFYTPDFYLPQFKVYFELRGHRRRSLKKPRLAEKQYKFVLVVMYQDDIEKIAHHFRDKNWEDSTKPNKFGKLNPQIYEKKKCKCGKDFYHRKSATNIGIYCSRECSNKFKWERKKSIQEMRKQNERGNIVKLRVFDSIL